MQRHTPRSILIVGPMLATVIGLAYRFGEPIRTASPSFDTARQIAPLSTWGLLFLAGAVAMSTSLLLHSHRLGAGTYFIGGVIYAWWASCFALQALTNAEASLVGWALYALVSGYHFRVSYHCWMNR